jgi:uncharacterized protein YciI
VLGSLLAARLVPLEGSLARRPEAHVFVLLIRYLAPLQRIDEVRPAHVGYLEEHYRDGTFLFSGRRRPPEGGVIVAGDVDRAELERIITTDPYVTEGVGEYQVIEFGPTHVADSMRAALAAAGVSLPS